MQYPLMRAARSLVQMIDEAQLRSAEVDIDVLRSIVPNADVEFEVSYAGTGHHRSVSVTARGADAPEFMQAFEVAAAA